MLTLSHCSSLSMVATVFLHLSQLNMCFYNTLPLFNSLTRRKYQELLPNMGLTNSLKCSYHWSKILDIRPLSITNEVVFVKIGLTSAMLFKSFDNFRNALEGSRLLNVQSV